MLSMVRNLEIYEISHCLFPASDYMNCTDCGWIMFTLLYMILKRNVSQDEVQAQASGGRAHRCWPGPGNLCGDVLGGGKRNRRLDAARFDHGWGELPIDWATWLWWSNLSCFSFRLTWTLCCMPCLCLMFDHAVFLPLVLFCPLVASTICLRWLNLIDLFLFQLRLWILFARCDPLLVHIH